MIAFLRFVGVANAGVWFGAAIFFMVAVVPAVFSNEMIEALSKQKYFAGLAAQVMIKHFFIFDYWCAGIALAHLLAERFYLGRRISQITLGLWIGIVSLTLIGGLWMQPKLRGLHRTMYTAPTSTQRDQAAAAFRAWHGGSQGVNLLVTAGLLVYFWRIAVPTDSGRFANLNKFRS